MKRTVLAVVLLAWASCAAARDSLGVYGEWGAFRDAAVPRCYAIAAPDIDARSESARRQEHDAFASIGTWPRRQVRGQFHMRLSRTLAPRSYIRLAIGAERFNLAGGGADAWAQDARMDAAIVAAMRSAGALYVTAVDHSGRRFTDKYSLEGAATAMDAATIGCARMGR
jgi:hypothetical protein